MNPVRKYRSNGVKNKGDGEDNNRLKIVFT